jgi:very-short-patch-repair endonuclease
MTAEIPDGDHGLSDPEVMEIYTVMIEKFWEFQLKDVREDAARASETPDIDSLYRRAFWHKKIDLLFQVDDLLKRRYGSEKGKLQLIQEVFGSALDLDPIIDADDVQQRLEWHKRQLAKGFQAKVQDRIQSHGIASPIEQLFLLQWDFMNVEDRKRVSLTPQQEVTVGGQTYRIDFCITSDIADWKLAVELDGHDFHEKTRAQAAKDKQRERALIRDGYTVVRFTGTEVVRDTAKCVSEVVALIDARSA